MNKEDLRKCSICLEEYKTPRYLPCLHTFCQECISSHILSECQAKENPVGFDCPLCRKFVPSPCLSVNFSEWCKRLPKNELLEKFYSLTDGCKVCEACQRFNEEEAASNYCLNCSEALCDNCTKCHRKSRASQDHKISPFDEIKDTYLQEMSKPSTNITCFKHKDRPIELYCNDHEEPCCTMCCCTDHRKCESVETVEEKAEKVRCSGSVDALLQDIRKFKVKLSEVKVKQESNITEIEDNTDKMTEKVQKLKRSIIQHVERLESEYLDEMSKLTKQCKEKLTLNIQALQDSVNLMKHCITNLESAKDLQGIDFLAEFLTAEKTLGHIKKSKLKVSGFTMESDVDAGFKAFTNLSKMGKIAIIETERNFEGEFDVKNLNLELFQEIDLPHTSARSLMLFSISEMFIPDRKNTNIFEYNRNNETWSFQREVKIGQKSFDIKRKDNVLFVSCPDSRVIKVISIDNFENIRTLSVSGMCLGLSIQNNFLYVACYDSIIKMDTAGNELKIYPTDDGVYFVVATKKRHVVYSNYRTSKVTAITDEGSNAWTYSHPSLQNSCGLHIDCDDILYVAATESNNVHVISNEGCLLRIFENIPKPVYFILNNERNFCCVSTKENYTWKTSVQIYSIK
ncbi:uncharacterized protein LOC134255110 [Saccostrea cucullata]|uniref:uncharacterized protein LOC134255110 n=1 Tax=Saccostrea cuccullata TaxID=36930 RepID=UPI002ED5F053